MSRTTDNYNKLVHSYKTLINQGEGRRGGTTTLYRSYIKLLDFADFVQAANSRIGPFASRVLNLTQ